MSMQANQFACHAANVESLLGRRTRSTIHLLMAAAIAGGFALSGSRSARPCASRTPLIVGFVLLPSKTRAIVGVRELSC
jgi:hypothetical protein